MNSINKCLFCSLETLNPKFCCRSCSVKFYNSLNPKRKLLTRKCKKCENRIDRENYLNQRKICEDCSSKISIKEKTYGEIVRLAKYQLHSQIRGLARTAMKKSGINKCCSVCSYDKHVEVCHIKPINSFGKEVLVSQINALSNLVYLCPNCHWEFDNDLLSIH